MLEINTLDRQVNYYTIQVLRKYLTCPIVFYILRLHDSILLLKCCHFRPIYYLFMDFVFTEFLKNLLMRLDQFNQFMYFLFTELDLIAQFNFHYSLL